MVQLQPRRATDDRLVLDQRARSHSKHTEWQTAEQAAGVGGALALVDFQSVSKKGRKMPSVNHRTTHTHHCAFFCARVAVRCGAGGGGGGRTGTTGVRRGAKAARRVRPGRATTCGTGVKPRTQSTRSQPPLSPALRRDRQSAASFGRWTSVDF